MRLTSWRKEILFNPVYWPSAIAFVSFILLLLTGFFLALWYEPIPEIAYESIIYIRDYVYFGQLLLSIHHHATNALIFATLLHLLRVFIMGTYKGWRYIWIKGSYITETFFGGELSHSINLSKAWYSGVLLLPIAVLFIFSGYLLRWDEVGYWSIKITTGIVGYTPLVGDYLKNLILGGDDITSRSLARFFTFHYFFLPMLYSALLLLHYYYIKKGRLYWIEIGVMSIAAGFLILLSLGMPFDLSDRVSPELRTDLKPPWLFLWLYVIERGVGYVSPALNFINILVLLSILLIVTFVPLFDRGKYRNRGMRIKISIATVILFILLSILGLLW